MYLGSSLRCTASFRLCQKATTFRMSPIHICKRSASNHPKHGSNIPIGGEIPKIPQGSKFIKPFLVKWGNALDNKFGRYNFLKPFYDSPSLERELSTVGLRLVYRDQVVSRAYLARGIWVGYGSVAVVTVGWISDIGGFGVECTANPIPCILITMMAVSFSIYAQFACRSYIYSIHAIEPKLPMANPRMVNKISKPVPQFVLTRANPLTGMARKERFAMSDVRGYGPQSTWSKLHHLLYRISPFQPNYFIRNRRFVLHPHCFVDDNFHGDLITASKAQKGKEKKGNDKKR